MEQAGGAASTGTCRILDVQPKDIHERIPTFIGSIENVYELDQFFEYYGSDEMESPEKWWPTVLQNHAQNKKSRYFKKIRNNKQDLCCVLAQSIA